MIFFRHFNLSNLSTIFSVCTSAPRTLVVSRNTRGHLTAKYPLHVKFLKATRLKTNQLSILLESTTKTSKEVQKGTSRPSPGTGRCVNEAPIS